MTDNVTAVCKALEQARDTESVWKIFTGFIAPLGVTSMIYRVVSPSGMPRDIGTETVELEVAPGGAAHFDVMNFAVEREILRPGFNLRKILYWKNTHVLPYIYENDNTLEHTFSYENQLAGVVFSAVADANRKAIFTMAFEDATRTYSQSEFRALKLAGYKVHQALSDMFFANQRQNIQLSDREKEILQKIIEGKSNNQIATETTLSRHTVDAYIRRVFLKLGVSDRTSAAVTAINFNLLSGPNYCSESDLAMKRGHAA